MNIDRNTLEYLCKVASTAATSAGEYIQSKLNQQLNKMSKTAGSSAASQIVTDVDMEAQRIILAHLQPTIDAHTLGLLTEESSDDHSRLNHSHFWCIDPLDGTLPFSQGQAGYAVSIALISKSGDPIIGVVYIPDTKQCFTAIKSHGLYLNDTIYNRSPKNDSLLNVFLDRSSSSNTNYDKAVDRLRKWANERGVSLKLNTGYGAVCNAIGSLSSDMGCYFKFPKNAPGGGSIWDFAATRLFFEELNLPVSNAKGNTLNLNAAHSTFMNEQGVLYSTDEQLHALILKVYSEMNNE